MKRVQRKRTKGWKMPENTVYVGRPSIFGNPYKTDDVYYNVQSYKFAVEWEIESLKQGLPPALNYGWARKIAENIHKLKGKNLACFCPLNRPCHAAALLKIIGSGKS